MARIGVALSGGGHRATAWGLGSLLAITDLGLNGDVVSISSVSGGSIANGVAAHKGDFASITTSGFEDAIRPIGRHMACEGLYVFGPPTDGWLLRFFAATALFVDLVVALLVASLGAGRDWAPVWFLLVGIVLGGAGWVSGGKLPAKFRVAVAGGLAAGGPIVALAVALTTGRRTHLAIVAGLLLVLVATVAALYLAFGLFSKRSVVVDAAMARAHFCRSDGGPSRLGDLNGAVHHVFCASELQSGDHVYFSPRLVYGYRVGQGTPGSMTLATAVQCSACLPGAFAARTLHTAGFNLVRSWTVADNEPPTVPDKVVVNDGGVYDNMADQWEQGIDARLRRVGPVQEPADQLVVVNASKALGWSPYPKGSVANELGGLTRTGNILYDVSTSHRRQALVARFQASAALGKGLEGALVHIAQSPYDVPRAFKADAGPAGARAQAALTALATMERTPEQWDAQARANAGVRTTLGVLGAATVADLLQHSWVLTVVNLYVILGYGQETIGDLANLGARTRFEALCT